MLFPANGAVEQDVIVAAMVIALFYLHASDVHQHTFNRSRVRLCIQWLFKNEKPGGGHCRAKEKIGGPT